MDLVLNKLECLICHKNKTNQTSFNVSRGCFLGDNPINVDRRKNNQPTDNIIKYISIRQEYMKLYKCL